MRKIYTFLGMFICMQVMGQLTPMSKQMAKDLYNGMNGASWVIINKDGSTTTVTENWLKEIPQRIGFKYESSPKAEDVVKIDLANCGLVGDMPVNCFTQPWDQFSSQIPEKYHKYYNTPRFQNETDNNLVAHCYGRWGHEVNLSHNKITSVTKDITAKDNNIGSIRLDHNQIASLPDFQHVKSLGVGGIWGCRGATYVDFSYNEISAVEKALFTSEYQRTSEKGLTGMFGRDGLKLDVSNNRLNFTNLLVFKQFIDAHPTAGDTRLSEFICAPQKPLGEDFEDQILDRGASVQLSFSLSHPQCEYRWYLNGEETPFTDKELNIISLTEAQAGVYQCKVTNPLIPGVELESKPMGVFLKKEGNAAPSNISISSTSAIAKSKAFSFTVGELSAEDADGDEVFFMLKGVDYDYSFRIQNGKYLVNAEELFDHFSIKSYDINVIAYDIYGNKTEKLLTIEHDEDLEALLVELYKDVLGEYYHEYNILGVEAVFSNVKDVKENTEAGFQVGEMSLELKYKNQGSTYINVEKLNNVSYELLPVNDYTDFELSDNKIQTAKAFNYEEKQKLKLAVKFTYTGTSGSLHYTNFLDVNVLNLIEPPKDLVLTSNTLEINNQIGARIGFITAIQEDVNYSPVHFSIENPKFLLNASELKAAAVFTEAGMESVEIICINEEGQELRKTFSIHLEDHSAPVVATGMGLDNFLLNVSIPVDDPIAKVFADVECDFTCEHEYFKINGRTILIKKELDPEQKKYSLEIKASTSDGDYTQSFDLFVPSNCDGTEIIEIDDQQSSKVYPNPANSVLNVEGAYKAEIFNQNGQLVSTDLLLNQQIDIQSLAPGLYHLRLYTDSGIESCKFIKK